MVGASTWARRPHDTGEPISFEMSSDISCICVAHELGGPGQDRAPLGGGHVRPRPVVDGLAGGGHGPVDVGVLGLGGATDQLAGRGGVDVEDGGD